MLSRQGKVRKFAIHHRDNEVYGDDVEQEEAVAVDLCRVQGARNVV